MHAISIEHIHKKMSLINIKQSIMVKPSKETPLKTLNLSNIDMIVRAPKTHTNIFYIYERPSSKSPPYFDAEILKNALSEILVPFYPLAGRLKMNPNKDKYVVDCNAKGALFVEAETSHTINEFNGFKPSATIRELMIPKCDYTSELSAIPLLMVQVTWFKCGGLGLGFAPHHHVADGAAHIDFFAKLLRLAGGSDLIVPPVHDRVHVSPRDPACTEFQHEHEFDPIVPSLPSNGLSLSGAQNETTQSLFKLSKQQILALKQVTLSQAMKYTKTYQRITTYALVAGHVWRSACNARGLAYDQEVKLYIPVDGRSRFNNPTIPQGYFGNVLFFAICTGKVGDIIRQPLWCTASKIQKRINKMDDKYLRSAVDYLELKNGLLDPLMGTHKVLYPNLLINSWARLPFYEADFGWGPPMVVGNCEIKLEGLSFLTGNPREDGSLTLAINLFSAHMSLFGKCLYNFTSINSSL